MLRSLKGIGAAAFFAISAASHAAPCAVGTLATYLALPACQIGATTFSGFELLAPLPAGATEIAAASIAITPLVSATDPGFRFDVTAAANAGDLLSALFRFQVGAGAGTSLLTASETLAGSAAGDGVVTFVTDLCFDGLFAAPPSGCGGSNAATIITFAADFDELLADSLPLDALALLDVVANVIVDGGVAGSAALSGWTLRFHTDATAGVGEPPTLALAALLLFIALAHRRTPRRAR